MNIAVIGATGLVGSAAVSELAVRGHQVSAIARNAAKVAQHPNVTDFAAKISGCDAVVSAFNAGWDNPNLAADIQTAYAHILAAAKTAAVPYLLVIGGAGRLHVAPNLQLVDTPDFPKDVYPGANAVRVLLDELRPRRDINWAFLSPAARFAVNPVAFEKTGKYRIGQDDVLLDADGSPADISVPDLACAIADDVEKQAHLFQRFTVAA